MQKILVLDDEKNYAEMLEALLEQHRFLVDSAIKPELALKTLQEEDYGLVISDYKMPVMDGADFLQRAREFNPELPFIIISGLMNTPELVKVANMGVTLVLEKPIDIENFITQVKRFVQPLSEEEYAQQEISESEDKTLFSPDGRRFIKTYPSDLEFVSEQSPIMQFFIQDVWDAAQEQLHVFVSIPSGGEIELIAREVSHWKGFSGKQCLIMQPGSSASYLKQRFNELVNDDNWSNVVTINGFANASLDAQAALVDAICEASEQLLFLYFIDSELLKAPEGIINDELLELLNESLCHMPLMRQRPLDLAKYVEHFLPQIASSESSQVASVSPEAAALMLSYSWPGNFAQLIQVLRAAVIIEQSDVLTKATLEQALSQEVTILPLVDSLRNHQFDVLADMARQSNEPIEKTAQSVGLNLGEYTEEAPPLLFPELTQPN